MPIKTLHYNKLEPLIRDNLSLDEHLPTAELIKTLKQAKKRGWLTKSEMILICHWKSPRAIHYIKSNRSNTIKKVTEAALNSRTEEFKMTELVKLKGVSIPMASAILMLTNPKRYGVIDIRVWEVMFYTGTVQTNSKGVNFVCRQIKVNFLLESVS